MGMWASSDFYHNGLVYLSSAVKEIYVCTTQVTSRSSAINDALAKTTTLSTASWTNSTGDTSGRKAQLAQQSNMTVTSSGTADHIVLCTSSTAVYITTCNSKALTTADTVTVPAWDIEIQAPTS